MNWYYVDAAGQQAGPLDEAGLDALLATGKISAETLVWKEGMANWQPIREARTSAVAVGAAPVAAFAGVGQVVCAECGKAFPLDEVVRVNNVNVCAACKPIFLQRLSEGSAPGRGNAPAGSTTEEQVRERDYEHSVSDYMGQSWELFKSDTGGILGAVLVVGLCLIVANIVPYLSIITGIVFTGPLMGGLYSYMVRKARSEPVSMGDAFSGFGPRFGQLLLGKFIPNLLAGLTLMPSIIVGVMIFVGTASAKQHGGGISFGVPLLIGGLIVFAGFCAMLYFQICWVFTLWLVTDKGMSFWPAMSLSRAVVRKHWWHTFWLSIVSVVLIWAGLLLCGVGALLTGPLSIGMWAYAYERLFGDMQSA